MNLQVLRGEIDGDPLTRGYDAMDNAQIANSLNTIDRSAPRLTITGNDLVAQTDPAELAALSAANREHYWGLAHLGTIDVGASTNGRAMLLALFGGGTTTRANLVALVGTDLSVSRATELGIGVVTQGDVEQAKGGTWQ